MNRRDRDVGGASTLHPCTARLAVRRVVVDDRPDRARALGVEHLLAEAARAALDQGDLPVIEPSANGIARANFHH